MYLDLHLHIKYRKWLHSVMYRMIYLPVNSNQCFIFIILTVERPCKLLLQWLCLHHMVINGKLFSGILAFVHENHPQNTHTHTCTLWKGIKYLIVYVLVLIYFVHFIATFKVHGHIRFFLGSILFFTLVKHILHVCLLEVFIVAFRFLWSPSCFWGFFTIFY